MQEKKINDISIITNTGKSNAPGPELLSEGSVRNVRRIHSELPFYEPTPLVKLERMAERLGIKAFYVKDESKRFGLNAFKGLGAVYVISCIAAGELGLDIDTMHFEDLMEPENRQKLQKMVFATTTDGNHGRGISWACGMLGCEAHINMPAGTSEVRAQAIRDVNPKAEVIITDMGYDDTVRYTSALAEKNGWYLVQDTSWEGYEDIPAWIVQGYTTMAAEACDAMDRQGAVPTHVFVQAGVGSMAGSVAGYMMNRYEGRRPAVGVVEPVDMACIYESARRDDKMTHAAVGSGSTIMAGLNCGEACTIIWPVLRDFSDWYIMCPDHITAYGMRLLAAPEGDDPKIISGESGAVTTGLVNTAAKPGYEQLREILRLDEDSVVLCFSTEGDTDPENYRRIVYEGAYPFPDQNNN